MTCDENCGKYCKKCLKLTKKYVDKRCIYKLTIDDIPTNIITNTTFSFYDIATDVLKMKERVLSNDIIKQFIKDMNIIDPKLIFLCNRILVNIALNVINDPNNPPPIGFIKRVTMISTDGDVIFDVTTYKDDDEGISLGLNKDTNIIYMSTNNNILDKPQNDLHQPIYNDNMIFPKTNLFLTPDIYFNVNNIDPKLLAISSSGLKLGETIVICGSNRTYTYPANEINPQPNGGVADSFNRIVNHGVRKEIQQARIQDWGYASRRSGTLNSLPSYYLAHNVNLGDGFSFILRISYARYK
jgi:hypothetical protein